MLNKLKFGVILLLLATNSHVFAMNQDYKHEIDCCHPPLLQEGFYVGAQLGYDVYRVRDSFNISINDEFSFLYSNPPLAAKGFVGGAFLGYGLSFHREVYVAAEAFFNVDDAKGSFELSSADDLYIAKVRARSSYGLAVLPGFYLSHDARAYLRIGYTWTRFKFSESMSNFILPLDQSEHENKRVGGWNVGIGLEKLVCGQFSYRAEYIYSRYNSISSNFNSTFKSSDNQFMLGLLYHF